MRKTKTFILIIFINLILIFSVIGLYASLPILSTNLIDSFKSEDYRSRLENYLEFPWAKQHFIELNNQKTEYRDFIVWRRLPFEGQTINIDSDGIRKTNVSQQQLNTQQFNFFGGSAMWGDGVNDEFTIPSLLSDKYYINAVNYADHGYTARQSLSLLINLYTEDKLKKTTNTMIFFDGVNDIAGLCRSEMDKMTTHQELHIQSIIEERNINKFSYLLVPMSKFLDRLKFKYSGISTTSIEPGTFYDCDINLEKAKKVAKYIVDTWNITSRIAEENGDRFIAILQPVSFFGNANINNIADTSRFKEHSAQGLNRQFEVVYPLIKNLVNQYESLNFLDFTGVFDNKESVYIDYCHVSPQGNLLLVDEFDKNRKLFEF